jgi:hypothetical protein
MSIVKGVIARSQGAPVEVVDVIVPDPGPGEAVVKIQACGVCHTTVPRGAELGACRSSGTSLASTRVRTASISSMRMTSGTSTGSPVRTIA